MPEPTFIVFTPAAIEVLRGVLLAFCLGMSVVAFGLACYLDFRSRPWRAGRSRNRAQSPACNSRGESRARRTAQVAVALCCFIAPAWAQKVECYGPQEFRGLESAADPQPGCGDQGRRELLQSSSRFSAQRGEDRSDVDGGDAPGISSVWPVKTRGNAPVRPQLTGALRDRNFLLLHAGMFAATAFDAHSTMRCLNAGTCREANPFIGSNPSAARVWGQSMAINGGITLLDAWIKRGHQRLWMVGPIVGIVAHGVAAQHNYGIGGRR